VLSPGKVFELLFFWQHSTIWSFLLQMSETHTLMLLVERRFGAELEKNLEAMKVA